MSELDEMYKEACRVSSPLNKHCSKIHEIASKCHHITELAIKTYEITISVFIQGVNRVMARSDTILTH